jgi:hypothetical protein
MLNLKKKKIKEKNGSKRELKPRKKNNGEFKKK